MTDKIKIGNALSDIVLDEHEKSYAFIGCARWGRPYWYEYEKPDVSIYKGQVTQFAKAVFQFAKDMKQGEPYIVSNFSVKIQDCLDGDVASNSEQYKDFYLSSAAKFMRSRNIMCEIKDSDGFDAFSLPFWLVDDCQEADLNKIMEYFLNVPQPYIDHGFVFIAFKDYVIQPTWHGWAVYARRHADVEFVRWFFTLISHVCNMAPAFLYDTRHPLLDDYNPLTTEY